MIVAGVLAGLAAGGALIYLNQQKLDERKTWDTGGTKLTHPQ